MSEQTYQPLEPCHPIHSVAYGLLLIVACACSGGPAESPGGTQPLERAALGLRTTTDKLQAVQNMPSDLSGARVVIKFREGTGVRLRGQTLMSDSASVGAQARSLSQSQLQSDLSRISERFSSFGIRIERHFALPDATLANLKQRGENRSGLSLADLALYFDAPWSGRSRAELAALIEDLNALESVEFPYVQPPPVSLRPATGATICVAWVSSPGRTSSCADYRERTLRAEPTKGRTQSWVRRNRSARGGVRSRAKRSSRSAAQGRNLSGCVVRAAQQPRRVVWSSRNRATDLAGAKRDASSH